MTAKKVVPSYFACDWEIADAAAIQALERGDATPEQQKRALHWIIVHAAGAYNETFTPEGERQSVFAQGRRYVGLQVVKLLKLSLNQLRKAQDNG